jgi:hypothetical protein
VCRDGLSLGFLELDPPAKVTDIFAGMEASTPRHGAAVEGKQKDGSMGTEASTEASTAAATGSAGAAADEQERVAVVSRVLGVTTVRPLGDEAPPTC